MIFLAISALIGATLALVFSLRLQDPPQLQQRTQRRGEEARFARAGQALGTVAMTR